MFVALPYISVFKKVNNNPAGAQAPAIIKSSSNGNEERRKGKNP